MLELASTFDQTLQEAWLDFGLHPVKVITIFHNIELSQMFEVVEATKVR